MITASTAKNSLVHSGEFYYTVIMKKLSIKDKIALRITSWVATIECAILFSILALISLPTAIAGGIGTTISWIAQTFLQLVLLSIIMVGQDLQNKQTDEIAEKHYKKLLQHDEKIDLIAEYLVLKKKKK